MIQTFPFFAQTCLFSAACFSNLAFSLPRWLTSPSRFETCSFPCSSSFLYLVISTLLFCISSWSAAISWESRSFSALSKTVTVAMVTSAATGDACSTVSSDCSLTSTCLISLETSPICVSLGPDFTVSVVTTAAVTVAVAALLTIKITWTHQWKGKVSPGLTGKVNK